MFYAKLCFVFSIIVNARNIKVFSSAKLATLAAMYGQTYILYRKNSKLNTVGWGSLTLTQLLSAM